MEPYKVLSSKFLGKSESGRYIYELEFNQSLVHTGRVFEGIEEGLNAYREREIKKEEHRILEEADKIRARLGMEPKGGKPEEEKQ